MLALLLAGAWCSAIITCQPHLSDRYVHVFSDGWFWDEVAIEETDDDWSLWGDALGFSFYYDD